MLWNKLFLVLIIIISVNRKVAAEEGFQYDAKGLRDPFVPIISAKRGLVSDIHGVSSIKDIRLEGIVWDGVGNSLAVINGEIFRRGDKIGSVKILKIEEKIVVFEVEEKEVKVQLRED